MGPNQLIKIFSYFNFTPASELLSHFDHIFLERAVVFYYDRILYIFNSFQSTPNQTSTDCDISRPDKHFNNFWKLSSKFVSSPELLNVSEVFVKNLLLSVITNLAFSGLESLKIFRSITLHFFQLYIARTSTVFGLPYISWSSFLSFFANNLKPIFNAVSVLVTWLHYTVRFILMKAAKTTADFV